MASSKYLSAPPDPRYAPTGKSMGVLFLDKIKQHANRIAQIDSVTGESQTYGDLLERSVRVAQHMVSRGVTREDIITGCSGNILDACLPLLASLYLGVRYSSLDPSLSLEDSGHLLGLVRPRYVFCSPEALALVEEGLERAGVDNCEIVVYGEWQPDGRHSHTPFSEFLLPTGTEESFEARQDVDPDDTAIIFFSSGTTGLPKGICCTHAGLLSKAPTETVQNGKIDGVDLNNFLYFTTFYWISAVSVLVIAIINGSTRVLCSAFEEELALKIIEKHKVSFMFLTPFQVYSFVCCDRFKEHDTRSLACLIVGGSVLADHQLGALRRCLPKVIVLNGYGLTETQGVCTFFNPATHYKHMIDKLGSVGKIFQGYTFKVVDPETEQVLGANEQGEIRVKGKSLLKEYYKNPEATAAAFDSEGFLRTGDIGYYDEDECFYIVDRIKEMFKFQSWHIIPAELESVLMEHPEVQTAAVIGLPHPRDGDRPLAVVIPRPGAQCTEQQILAWFNGRVSDRKQLRAGVRFVPSLPYTPSGKLQRRTLRQMMIQQTITTT